MRILVTAMGNSLLSLPLTFLLINVEALLSFSKFETNLAEKEGLESTIDSIRNLLPTCILRLTFLETEQMFIIPHVLAKIPAFLDDFTSMKNESYSSSRSWQDYKLRSYRFTVGVRSSRANCSLALLFDTFNTSQCTSIGILRLHGKAMSIGPKFPTPFKSHYAFFFYHISDRHGLTYPQMVAKTIHEQFRNASFSFRFRVPAIFIILTTSSLIESMSYVQLASKSPIMPGWFYCWYCGKDRNFVQLITQSSSTDLALDALKTYKMSINGGTNVYWNTDVSGSAAKLTQLKPFCIPTDAVCQKRCT